MDQLKLSKQLVDKLQQVITDEDERAKDPLLASQYLAAVIGFMVGNHDFSAGEKSEVMNELNAFAKHVCDDIARQKQATMRPKGEAFGIWKPGDN